MAKKSVFRRNSIKIGLIALGLVILLGLVANISDVFVIGFEAVPFTVPTFFSQPELSQLALASNFAIDCRVWVQGDIVDVDGGRTPFQPKTQTFNPQFDTLSVINIRTEQVIDRIDTEIRLRCEPGNISGVTFGEVTGGLLNTYEMTGGTVQYFWVADDEDNTQRTVTSQVTRQIPFADNVVQTSTGGGITLASPSVTGQQIDDALTSSKETYFTSASLVVTAKPEFEFKLGCDGIPPIEFACAVDQTEFATVNLNAGIGTVKVFNQIVNPPKPSSEEVKFTEVATEIDNEEQTLFSDSTGNIDLVVRIQLPQWDAAEGVPQIDLFRPTVTGGQAVSTNFPITAKKVVDSSTDTYEFFDTNIQLPQNPTAGQWVVVAHHPGRSGEDTSIFAVLERDNQQDEDDVVIECDVSKDPNCDSTTEEEEEERNGGLGNFLNIGDFIDCFRDIRSGDFDDLTDCLNDDKFLWIYVIFGVIILLLILSSVGRRY